ncbi:LacI family transcriptional regulator [Ancylobacter sp. MQZ15Z-1]|uniref:LacI family transcriptional regulator n=1 Tax=Ancylobacter mangrovi TaxID=2972472 RepID=A0A9X2T763_9HYPH|nr:LacI family DNA-binding transcriptional regulator [Ancylobacter mangrovi]MCS0495713.1 LacI family transcriptional regulator [Ancylobacter mangrovi]
MVKPPHTSAPTIRLVAREAGVSQATVSRAFSQPELLAPATVEKVLSTAKRLGYVPNQVARALSTGRTHNIALILPDVANPFFSALMRGAQAQAYKRGYATFLGDSDETASLEDLLLDKLAVQVDGFVLASPRLDEERIRRHAGRRPLVVINRELEGIERVLVDTASGFADAVKLLAGFGHRVIAYVGAPRSSWSSQQRARAVCETGAALGLKVAQIDAARPSHEAGRACVDQLLNTGATAALAVDDVVAQGIMAGLADRGLSVPHDFSVIGCDDIIATTTYPPLTTVNAYCGLAGAKAVDLLLNGLSEPAAPVDTPVIVGELIVRGTTGPAPQGGVPNAGAPADRDPSSPTTSRRRPRRPKPEPQAAGPSSSRKSI